MKVSVETIRQFTEVDMPTSELVELINTKLGGVEEVIELGDVYADALLVRIVHAEKHPDADKLTICKIDDKGVNTTAARDDDGLVTVVCGAPNARAGIVAIWLPPQSVVPSTAHDAEPFRLDARPLRGVMSQGMLAASDELGIGSDHDGIVELTDADVRGGDVEACIGRSMREVFGLGTIIDIENKMFTHRPDCFGQLGVAREIAGIQGAAFESPEWYRERPVFESVDTLPLTVRNECPEKTPRFMAVVLSDVNVRSSPFWLQCALVAMGSKPINNIVDWTNYVMLLTGQPLHAYDYDTIRGATICARMAHEGEEITLLNDKTVTLTAGDIVIADAEKAIGLAGVMGGRDTEVSATTTRIVLECANFDMYTIRKTSMRHGLFTDAVTRFNKGQSPMQCDVVLAYAMQQMGVTQASAVVDRTNEQIAPRIEAREGGLPFEVDVAMIRSRLGIPLSKHEMVTLLGNVEFPLCEDCGWNNEDEADNNEPLHINVPFWRTDIVAPEDIVEELGRLYGFDALPRGLPKKSAHPTARVGRIVVKRALREAMKRLGANELLTYSFVHEQLLKKAEQDVEQAFCIANALSPDLQYYRLSVLPSLLDKVYANIRAGHDEFVLYELGKALNKKYHADDDEGLPREMNFFDAVYASKHAGDGAPLYRMRAVIDTLAKDLGIGVTYTPADTTLDYPVTAPFDLSRSAMVMSENGVFLGMIGELKQSVIKSFKLPHYVATFTGDTSGWQEAYESRQQRYRQLSKYPSTAQDISLKVHQSVSYGELYATVLGSAVDAGGDDMDIVVTPTVIYQPEGSEMKSVTFRVRMSHMQKTLTDKQATNIIDAIMTEAERQHSAERG